MELLGSFVSVDCIFQSNFRFMTTVSRGYTDFHIYIYTCSTCTWYSIPLYQHLLPNGAIWCLFGFGFGFLVFFLLQVQGYMRRFVMEVNSDCTGYFIHPCIRPSTQQLFFQLLSLLPASTLKEAPVSAVPFFMLMSSHHLAPTYKQEHAVFSVPMSVC